MTIHLLATATVVGVVGLTGLAVHKYEHKLASTKPAVTVGQLQGQLKSTERELSLVKAVDKVNLSSEQSQVSTLSAQKTQLCTQLKSAKLTSPACQ